MKKTTAIIIILCVIIVALSAILIYEVKKDDLNIIIQPPKIEDDKPQDGDVKNPNTQLEPDDAIVQDEVEENNCIDYTKRS